MKKALVILSAIALIGFSTMAMADQRDPRGPQDDIDWQVGGNVAIQGQYAANPISQGINQNAVNLPNNGGFTFTSVMNGTASFTGIQGSLTASGVAGSADGTIHTTTNSAGQVQGYNQSYNQNQSIGQFAFDADGSITLTQDTKVTKDVKVTDAGHINVSGTKSYDNSGWGVAGVIGGYAYNNDTDKSRYGTDNSGYGVGGIIGGYAYANDATSSFDKNVSWRDVATFGLNYDRTVTTTLAFDNLKISGNWYYQNASQSGNSFGYQRTNSVTTGYTH